MDNNKDNPGDQQKDNEDDNNREARERLRQRLSSKRPSDNHQCTICLNPIRDLAFADSCLHPFCRSCIMEWSNRSNNCPVCRTVFNNVLTNIQADSNHDTVPIEPPPQVDGTVPFINIVRDIIVSPDGRSTVIRTRIINEDETTEITEVRGTGRHSPAIGPNPPSPENRFIGQSAVTSPTISPRSTTEMDEVDRFMGLLFRSLLSPEPLSAISFVENPAEARITRLTRRPDSTIAPHPTSPGPTLSTALPAPSQNQQQQQSQISTGRPLLSLPSPKQAFVIPVRPLSRPLSRPFYPSFIPSTKFATKLTPLAPKVWTKHSFKNLAKESLSRIKTLPAQLSSQKLSTVKSSHFIPSSPKSVYPTSGNLNSSKSVSSRIMTSPKSLLSNSLVSPKSTSSKSLPKLVRSSGENDPQQSKIYRRSQPRPPISGKNVPKSKDSKEEQQPKKQ